MWEGRSRRCDPRVRTPGHRDVPYRPQSDRAARAAKGRGGTGAKDANGGFMSSRLRISVSALLFLITPIASLAQSTPPQAPPTVHETVVVTATGRETPESKVGASIAVVNRDEIEQRHALSTIDLLRTIPGMVAVRSGGIGNL